MTSTRAEYNRQWRAKNTDRLKKEKALYDKENRAARREYKVLQGIKQRAVEKGLEFDLELEDITQYSICPVLGIELKRGEGKPQSCSPSVDRIDPTKGYTKDNIQILSNKANTMKQDATPEELLMFAKWIFKTYGENK